MFDRMIRYAARLDPHAVAAIAGTAHVSYAELDRSVDQIAVRLHAALPAASAAQPTIVGIAVRDVYLDLLLSLACARLGLASTSLPATYAAQLAPVAGVTALIADDAALSPAILADRAWVDAAFAVQDPAVPKVAIDPEATGRIQLSSGTTGRPKACVLSWALLERRLAHTPSGLGAAQRFLSLIDPSSGALQVFLYVWVQGGTVIFGDVRPAVLARQLPALRPNSILATPIQIKAIIDAMPAGAPPLPDCAVSLAGSRAERSLRRLIGTRIGARIRTAYGSTEGGVAANAFAADADEPGYTGHITPWTEAQVVGADGEPLSPGEPGRLRFRGPDVILGYLGEAPFADGWFDTGDLATIDADDRLVVLGRIDDVMNLGGRKLAPEELEEAVRDVPGVADVAAFALPDASGVDQAWLAIVRDGELDEAAVGAALPPDIGTVRLTWIEAIPRTPVGKPRREQLRESAARLPDPAA